MIKKGAYDLVMGYNGACLGGHLNIVKLMIEKGLMAIVVNKHTAT